MPCIKCLHTPGYHNFVKFGFLGNTTLIYTSPAKTQDYNEDGTKLANITIHVNELDKKPWIWVLDCGEMELKHYTEISFTLGLLKLLSNDEKLQEVWIMRPNIWIRTTVNFLKTFYSAKILNNIKYFEGTKMELLEQFQQTEIPISSIHWLIGQ
jgi:hypothetical protein